MTKEVKERKEEEFKSIRRCWWGTGREALATRFIVTLQGMVWVACLYNKGKFWLMDQGNGSITRRTILHTILS